MRLFTESEDEVDHRAPVILISAIVFASGGPSLSGNPSHSVFTIRLLFVSSIYRPQSPKSFGECATPGIGRVTSVRHELANTISQRAPRPHDPAPIRRRQTP